MKSLELDEYGFAREHYVFRNEGQRDAFWEKLCSLIGAPKNSPIVHAYNQGEYVERSLSDVLSHGTTRLEKYSDNGQSCISILFAPGLANSHYQMLESCLEASKVRDASPVGSK